MTIKAIILTLVLGLLRQGGLPDGVTLPDTHPTMVRAAENAAAVETVVEKLVSNPTERLAWARIIYVFGYFEASWLANPKGSNDQGSACGVMQVHTPEKFLPGATCSAVRKDLALGYEVGLTLMLQLEAQCGSKAAALTAYATNGSCPKGWILPLVRKRCKLAGLTSDCRLLSA